MQETLEKLLLPEISSATDDDVVAYLRHSFKFAEMAALAERDALIFAVCEQLSITVTEEELQAAGDAFRLEHKLLGAAETLAWLGKQRISVEDWSKGGSEHELSKELAGACK